MVQVQKAGPPYKQVKHLLEAPKKLKKLTAKKGPKFKEKKKKKRRRRKIVEVKWL